MDIEARWNEIVQRKVLTFIDEQRLFKDTTEVILEALGGRDNPCPRGFLARVKESYTWEKEPPWLGLVYNFAFAFNQGKQSEVLSFIWEHFLDTKDEVGGHWYREIPLYSTSRIASCLGAINRGGNLWTIDKDKLYFFNEPWHKLTISQLRYYNKGSR